MISKQISRPALQSAIDAKSGRNKQNTAYSGAGNIDPLNGISNQHLNLKCYETH